MKKNNKKGFTLAELLVVIAIIAILVAIAIPVFSSATDKAKQAADDANIRAAYSEHQIHEIDEDMSNDASISDKTVTFADGSTYTLQYYSSVNTSAAGVWKGTK